MKTESTNLVKSQPAKRNTQFWKNVMIGGVPGILIGAAGTGLATTASATTPVVDPVEPSSAELSPLPIAEVSDDMSFGEAFAAAREQVGAGGVFEWRGNVYNTYSEEEWGAMSPEDRAEFADRLSVTPIEIEEEVDESLANQEEGITNQNQGGLEPSEDGEGTAGGQKTEPETDADGNPVEIPTEEYDEEVIPYEDGLGLPDSHAGGSSLIDAMSDSVTKVDGPAPGEAVPGETMADTKPKETKPE